MSETQVIENAEVEPVKEEKAVEEVAVTVADVKESAIQDVSAQVGIIAEAQGLAPEQAQVVADVAVEAVADAVDAVETAVEEAQTTEAPKVEEAPKAEEAVENSVDPKDARILELEAKVNELQAVIDEAGKARQEAELKNRIAEELSKYPSLCNREEAEELLRKDWDLGSKFLASLKSHLATQPTQPKVIQNRIPAKAPDASYAGMSVKERIKAKMFHR